MGNLRIAGAQTDAIQMVQECLKRMSRATRVADMGLGFKFDARPLCWDIAGDSSSEVSRRELRIRTMLSSGLDVEALVMIERSKTTHSASAKIEVTVKQYVGQPYLTAALNMTVDGDEFFLTTATYARHG